MKVKLTQDLMNAVEAAIALREETWGQMDFVGFYRDPQNGRCWTIKIVRTKKLGSMLTIKRIKKGKKR